MDTKLKKLSFVIPSYNALKWFESNKSMWSELSKIVELIIVEDTIDGQCKDFANQIGAKYYSKENGNWGSVINFVKNNKIITTEYMAIVDSDDVIIIDDLKVLLENLGEYDLYYTNYIKKSFTNGNEEKINLAMVSNSADVYPFIHTVWFRTKLLYDLKSNLPEKVPYTDGLLDIYFLSNSKYTMKYINVAPYVYMIDVPGQTAKPKVIGDSVKNYYFLLRMNEFIDTNSSGKRNTVARKIAIKRYRSIIGYTNNKSTKKLAFKEIRNICGNIFWFIIAYLQLSTYRNMKKSIRKNLSQDW